MSCLHAAACDAPPKPRNWRLYHLLDFKPPACTSEVKFTARKATLRTQYYHAYLTLSERSRKIFYDAGGEAAYGFISSGSWGPLIPSCGIRAFAVLYVLVVLLQVGLLMAFFVMLGLRTDDSSRMDWNLVAIPMELFGCIAVLVTFVAMIVSTCASTPEKKPFQTVTMLSPVGNFFAACAYAITFFLLAAAVKGNPASEVGKYMKYLIGPIIGDSLYYIASFSWRWPSFVKRLMKIDGNQPSGVVFTGIFLMGFAHWFCGVAQWVLLGLKLDGTIDCSWYYVFLPFGVRAFLRVLEAFLRAWMHYIMRIRSVIMVVFDTLSSFFSNGILILSLYFVGVRIEEGKDKVRMGVALCPVYLTLLYMFLSLIFTLAYLLRKVNALEAEEIRLSHLFVPPPGALGGDDLYGDRAYDALDTPGGSFPSELEEHKEPLAVFNSTSDSTVPSVARPQPRAAPAPPSHLPYGEETDTEEGEEETESETAAEDGSSESDAFSHASDASTIEKRDTAPPPQRTNATSGAEPEASSYEYEYEEEEVYLEEEEETEDPATEDVTPQSREQLAKAKNRRPPSPSSMEDSLTR
eukprot:gene6714-4811_t